MKSIRLLPVVVFAAFALLVLKSVGLVTEGGYALLGTDWARAQEQEPAPDPDAAQGEGAPDDAGAAAQEEIDLTESDVNAAEKASEDLFSRAEPAPVESSRIDAVPVTQNSAGDKIPVGSADGVDQTEKAVLERLSERRSELDSRAADLDQREELVRAAEKRIEERIAKLEDLEARINSLVDQKKAQDAERFNSVVSMYESMKARDAAAIFNDLQSDVLVRVATQMSPRKLAPIMAEMDTEQAQQLTMRLAQEEPEPALDQSVDDMADLPQIVGE